MIVGDGSRALRRSVRPVVWLVLEELALTAVAVDGIVAASTSARAIAAELGLDPATTASALRVLRDRGLVELTRPTGTAGRFGLSVYRLCAVAHNYLHLDRRALHPQRWAQIADASQQVQHALAVSRRGLERSGLERDIGLDLGL